MSLWGAGCCRPTGECIYFSDDFDDIGRTEPETGWNEKTGDWSVSDQKLVCASGGGLLQCTVAHPRWDESMCNGVDCEPFNGAARLIVNYKDEDNYLFGRFDFTGKTIAIYRRSGGGDSLIRQVAAPTIGDSESVRLTVQFSKTHISASASTVQEEAFDCCAAIEDGYYSGLASEGGEASTWDNYQVQQHNRTWEGPGDCCLSVCQCVQGTDAGGFEKWVCVPRSLTLTFSATGDFEETLDGEEMTLTNESDIATGDQMWEGQGTICNEDWCFKLVCNGNDPADWAICFCGVDNYCQEDAEGGGIQKPHPTCTDHGFAGANPVEPTCDPFVMEFGPFSASQPEFPLPGEYCECLPTPGSGTFTLTITPTP